MRSTVLLLALILGGTAMAQQADITGPQLLSGEADAKLQALAREAAAAKKKLIITAPDYWNELILDQVRRGGGDKLEVEIRPSFAEAVILRTEDATPAAPPPTPAPVAATPPAPTPTPAPAQPVNPPRPQPAPAQPVTRPTTPPAPVVKNEPAPQPVAPVKTTPPSPPPAQPVAQPVTQAPAPTAATPPSTPPATAPAAKPVATGAVSSSAEAEINSIRATFEQSLNQGRKITRSLAPQELEPGDVIYVRGPVKAILRRQSLRNDVFWLDGDIELMRVELKEITPTRYQVMERIRSGDVRLRAVRSEEESLFSAEDPTRHNDERKSMERRYNGGNAINEKVAPNELRQKDIIYLGDDLAIVVRVSGLDLERYWLIGKVNLGRTELIKDGTNKYKVLQDMR